MVLRLASILLLELLSGFGFIADATTFIPLAIEDQIDASDSVVLATNTKKAYKRLPTGDVVTEYSFELQLASGLPEYKIVSPKAFKILALGGQWQGRYYEVHGSATFSSGEESLIFLRQTPYGWSVNNMAMGKFKVFKDTTGTWFRNTVFPDDPRLGLISMEKMNELLEQRFETPLLPIEIDRYLYKKKQSLVNKKKSKRKVASNSFEEVLPENSSSEYATLWMILILGILGFFYRVYAKNKKNH